MDSAVRVLKYQWQETQCEICPASFWHTSVPLSSSATFTSMAQTRSFFLFETLLQTTTHIAAMGPAKSWVITPVYRSLDPTNTKICITNMPATKFIMFLFSVYLYLHYIHTAIDTTFVLGTVCPSMIVSINDWPWIEATAPVAPVVLTVFR